MQFKRLFALLMLAMTFTAVGKPAAWYWWASRLDGQRICAQTAPAQGWLRDSGPFADSRCSDVPPRRP